MTNSKSTDKLEILTELAKQFAGKNVTADSISLTWEVRGGEDWAECFPVVQIKNLKITQ